MKDTSPLEVLKIFKHQKFLAEARCHSCQAIKGAQLAKKGPETFPSMFQPCFLWQV